MEGGERLKTGSYAGGKNFVHRPVTVGPRISITWRDSIPTLRLISRSLRALSQSGVACCPMKSLSHLLAGSR